MVMVRAHAVTRGCGNFFVTGWWHSDSQKKKNNMAAEKKKAAKKRKIKKFKREEMRLRHKAKKQHYRAAASPSIASFYRHDGKVALPWMPNSFESISFAGAVPGSVPGLPGGSDDYVPSNVNALPDCSSSFFFLTLIIRARAVRRGGIGHSQARRSFFPSSWASSLWSLPPRQ
jgi:hypothetical protein